MVKMTTSIPDLFFPVLFIGKSEVWRLIQAKLPVLSFLRDVFPILSLIVYVDFSINPYFLQIRSRMLIEYIPLLHLVMNYQDPLSGNICESASLEQVFQVFHLFLCFLQAPQIRVCREQHKKLQLLREYRTLP